MLTRVFEKQLAVAGDPRAHPPRVALAEWSAIVSVLAMSPAITSAAEPTRNGGPDQRSNILFVILDDVGADQLRVSNPLGVGLAHTPTITAIAQQGVNFTNCWAMPECSPSRVCFFTGRFPMRTGVVSPMTQPTLPQSQCSPLEATTPRLLTQAGYSSMLIGKFHIAQSDWNPAGIAAPASCGFTNFNGTLLGAPPYIDPTIAGQATRSDGVGLSCGLPIEGNAPAICACGFQDGTCAEGVDALECLQLGGVPLVDSAGNAVRSCANYSSASIAWGNFNGNYVWPRTVNSGDVAYQESPVRVYADTDQALHAVQFIRAQRALSHRWMCTLSFSGDHDPWQPPPAQLLPPGSAWPTDLPLVCDEETGVKSATPAQRELSNRTIESMDQQIRQVLIATGLAHEGGAGLTLTAPDTVIVVVGDNGSFLTTVRAPFNPVRAKATVYQTGVCVPLVIAGGPTVAPGRACDSMVSVVDLFELWGELAGIDVRAAVPEGRRLDSRGMKGYLTTPDAANARQFNYSGYAAAHLAEQCFPCLLSMGGGPICTDSILTTQQLCESQGGVWYGPGGSTIYTDCCDLMKGLAIEGELTFVYAAQQAITDGRWKLVVNTLPWCVDESKAHEFYDLAACPFAEVLHGRGVDNPECNLLASDHPLAPPAALAYTQLKARLAELEATAQPCPGDATMNGVVNALDIGVLMAYWGGPSVCDFNNDATTNAQDLGILLGNYGVCGAP